MAGGVKMEDKEVIKMLNTLRHVAAGWNCMSSTPEVNDVVREINRDINQFSACYLKRLKEEDKDG